MKIIVVDDESSALHLFLDEALQADDEVDFHYFKDDPETIISYVKGNEVSGAFLDVRMPRINGISLARALLEANPNIHIVFLTGTSTTMEDLPEDIRPRVLGIAYKPFTRRDLLKFIEAIRERRSVMEVRCFGSFDCFVRGEPVPFSSSKSRELFAFLIVANGVNVTMEQVITALWPDKDIDKAKILYRDAVWRLRSTLEEIHFPCVNFRRALLSVNTANIHCDYYELIRGKNKNIVGPFLPSYEWSLELEDDVEQLRHFK